MGLVAENIHDKIQSSLRTVKELEAGRKSTQQQAEITAEEGRIVGNAHVLDDANRGDLVVARVGREVAHVAILDEAAPLEPLALDARGRPLRLLARQRDPVRPHPVVLGGPDAEAAPAAADVEHPLAGLEAELGGDVRLLVRLRLLQPVCRIGEIGAAVLPVGIEEQGIEVAIEVVVMRRIPPCPAGRIELLQSAPKVAREP